MILRLTTLSIIIKKHDTQQYDAEYRVFYMLSVATQNAVVVSVLVPLLVI